MRFLSKRVILPHIRMEEYKVGKTYSEAQANASRKYMKQFDDIKVRVPKGKREEYQQLAKDKGTSLNRLIIELLENAIKEGSH